MNFLKNIHSLFCNNTRGDGNIVTEIVYAFLQKGFFNIVVGFILFK